nr:hypothetical protein [Sphingomonas tagetis]
MLAKRYETDPAAVQQFNRRMAKLAAAAKRERQRVDHLVLGKPRPAPVELKRPDGMTKATWKIERKRLLAEGAKLEPGIEEAVQLREKWSHKAVGTPETWEQDGKHTDALIQMEKNGTITKEQVEHAAQIANVHRSIESDVAVKVASLEARVDSSRRGGAVAERIHRVRMHHAYTIWRQTLPLPRELTLDMIVGEEGYTVVARRYRVHNRKARRLLIVALDRWPLCVASAFSAIDQETVDAMNEARPPRVLPTSEPHVRRTAADYELARAMEAGRDKTDEPYLLPPIDPVFLDDRGLLKPWHDIAEIVRERAFGAESTGDAESA